MLIPNDPMILSRCGRSRIMSSTITIYGATHENHSRPPVAMTCVICARRLAAIRQTRFHVNQSSLSSALSLNHHSLSIASSLTYYGARSACRQTYIFPSAEAEISRRRFRPARHIPTLEDMSEQIRNNQKSANVDQDQLYVLCLSCSHQF